MEETTTNKFNEEWEKLRPTIIQLSTDTTIEQFNRSWEELRPQVIELSQTTTSNKFDEKWEELRPQLIELAQTTTSNKFDEKWEALQPTLTETVNNLAKTQTTTTFNEKWEEYSDTSENIFPWTTEPTPTVENNVSINSAGTGNYYVLTENEDKTIKKLDYYFKYTHVYTKGAPYYNTGQTFNGLDLTGYTVKTFMLKNNIFKLKDSNGDLIDYVYFDLNSADISGGTAGDIHYTMVNMQFIPAVTKWTGKEEANGNVEFNTCITLILEKTSL